MPIFARIVEDGELARAFAVERRPIPDPAHPASIQLARELTGMLKRTAIPYPFRCASDILYATQALALNELWRYRGLLAPIRVGGGKSLLAYLAIAVMKPKRPMLIVPASMLEDTENEWRQFERHWRGPRYEDVTILSYERISNPSSAEKVLPSGVVIYPDIMERHRPDMIVMDECDRAGDVTATGTIRIGRYIEQHNPIVMAMSGTLIRRSLKDASHIMEWTLGDRCPLPRIEQFKALQALSDCLDPRGGKGGKRTEPGALLPRLPADLRQRYDQAETGDDARGVLCEFVGTHILETPGVVGSQDGPLAIPARIDPFFVEDEDDAIEEQYRLFLEGDEEAGRPKLTLPDGTLLPDARAAAMPLLTLGMGFVLMQDPPAPEEYRLARSAYHKGVREVILDRPELKLDSEKVVRDAIVAGRLPELEDLLEAWQSAKAHYTATTGLAQPPSVPTWFSDEVVHEVKRWLDAGTGIIWVSYIALGERLSKDLKLPYFAGGKCDKNGRHVTKLRKGEPAILSISSCGRGTNGLQWTHHRQLWMGAPSEQPLARLHRPGQEAACVLNDVYLGSSAALARYERQVSTAVNFQGKLSKQAQKLEFFQSYMPERIDRDGRRWKAVKAKDVEDVGEDC